MLGSGAEVSMKTIAAVVLAVLATLLLFPRSSGQAATHSPSVGRYTIVHTYQNRALMLDTLTGEVWQLTYSDYCDSGAPTYKVWPSDPSEQCKAGSSSISNVVEFQRVTVDGLYRTELQKLIDAGEQKLVVSSPRAHPKQ